MQVLKCDLDIISEVLAEYSRPNRFVIFIANDRSFSVDRCVIPCAFLIKVSNIHFLIEKCILYKKNKI